MEVGSRARNSIQWFGSRSVVTAILVSPCPGTSVSLSGGRWGEVEGEGAGWRVMV